ncbi:hypothetical protein DTO271G3_33 [Paecilomyces variotii]|nr:hypothetical protein DTO271G3_33 [Paecilomyces variotii]
MAPRSKTNVPRYWSEWAAVARKLGVYGETVHSREVFESGSKVTEEEYLLLRVLSFTSPTALAVKELKLERYHKQASDWLDTFTEFGEYLQSVKKSDKPGTRKLGVFEITFYQQYMVCQLLEGTSKSKMGLEDINEEIVNTSLLSFLTAICLKNPDIEASWTPQRATFTATFRKAKQEGKKSLNCQVDGFLVAAKTSQTKVILEAKARHRIHHEPQVSRQEAYEMIAALPTPPPKGLPRDRVLLISQDGKELYLSTALYEGGYKRYLVGTKDNLKKSEFLNVHRYGPWMIDERDDMDEFAKIALALALRASAED